jgi:iron-sulfur cluster assembly 2
VGSLQELEPFAPHREVFRPSTAAKSLFPAALPSLLRHQRPFAAAAPAAEPRPADVNGADDDGGLSVTPAAIERLRSLGAHSDGGPVLRLAVDGGGCSGFQYEFTLDEAPPKENDRVFSSGGVRVVCDDLSLEFLRGATVDFESDLMRSAFVVLGNPNADSSCGCGSSFAVK